MIFLSNEVSQYIGRCAHGSVCDQQIFLSYFQLGFQRDFCSIFGILDFLLEEGLLLVAPFAFNQGNYKFQHSHTVDQSISQSIYKS